MCNESEECWWMIWNCLGISTAALRCAVKAKHNIIPAQDRGTETKMLERVEPKSHPLSWLTFKDSTSEWMIENWVLNSNVRDYF